MSGVILSKSAFNKVDKAVRKILPEPYDRRRGSASRKQSGIGSELDYTGMFKIADNSTEGDKRISITDGADPASINCGTVKIAPNNQIVVPVQDISVADVNRLEVYLQIYYDAALVGYVWEIVFAEGADLFDDIYLLLGVVDSSKSKCSVIHQEDIYQKNFYGVVL